MGNRKEILESLGVRKAPELVVLRGRVAPSVAELIRSIAKEAGVPDDEVAGIALADWARKVERKLAKGASPKA